jgi:hypothetical protein
MTLPSHTSDCDDFRAGVIKDATNGIRPTVHAREAIRRRIMQKIDAPAVLALAREAVSPGKDLAKTVWQRTLERISPLAGHSFWSRLRAAVAPPEGLADLLRSRLLPRLDPVPAYSTFSRALRVTAAFALFAFVVRMSPFLFLASHSNADSPVLLVPMQGEVSVLMSGLWEPVKGEVTLKNDAQIRTGKDGLATVIVRDDGVLRLASDTTVDVQQLSDREKDFPHSGAFALVSGTMWVQALVPETLSPGWVVSTSFGDLRVNEGSVSIHVDAAKTDVAVWDRIASVRQGRTDIALVTGEGMVLTKGGVHDVRTMVARESESSWVTENLKRDAVHRKEIALLQQARHAQNAGILPTSTLYPVKRVAEAVDMLLTFGSEAKAQKMLDQANTRLDEAAALLADGSGSVAAAAAPLAEYKQTLLAVATGSGQDVQSLVQEQLASEAADVSAALPDDQSYLIKKTVLEAAAELPRSTIKPEDVQGAILVDSLSALTHKVQQGDLAGATTGFNSLKTALAMAQDPSSRMSTQLRKEARAALTAFAVTVRGQDQDSGTGAQLSVDLVHYLPSSTSTALRPMTDDEVDAVAQGIYTRIFLYKQPRSRYDQLLFEFQQLEGNPDQGRILRRLYHVLPENGLAKYVRTEFQRVREEVAKEGS